MSSFHRPGSFRRTSLSFFGAPLLSLVFGCSGSNQATTSTDSSTGTTGTATSGGSVSTTGSGSGSESTGGGGASASDGGSIKTSDSGASTGQSGLSDGGGSTGTSMEAGPESGTRTSGSTGGATVDAASLQRTLSCDDIGSEPVIPEACATVLATKTITGGIPSDESTLDTQAIQSAINACPAGQSVKLAVDGDKSALLSGALTLKAGVTLWIDAGVTLFASRNPRDFDAKAGQCGLGGSGNSSCNALINVKAAANAAVMGAGTIDGRGGEVVTGGTSTWWQLETADDGQLAAPRLIQVSLAQNFTLYRVTLRNAPKFHVVIDSTAGYRVWGITINTPPNAPNTDGVDPSASSNGVIAYSKISTGDDNVAVKGSGQVDGLIVAHDHFGRGHGMSIGSETNGGVRNILVCDLSLDGTDNGLRIKSDVSRGGLVQWITYDGVCMRKVKNPLVFDPYYSDNATGTLIPYFRDIVVKNVHMLGAGNLTLSGYDASHLLGLTLDNVVFDDMPTPTASEASITLGPGPVSFTPSGTDVTVMQLPADDAVPRNCDDAWVTF